MNLVCKKVLNILQKENIEFYIVGGYVRDLLLNRTTFDIDIAVIDTLPTLLHVLRDFNPIQKFHSLFFSVEEYQFTITPLRIEGKYGEDRKPQYIKNTTKPSIDSLRRDFTINALYLAEDGSVFDFHEGLNHLKQKKLVSIGDPYIRLEEDPIRILRALRFASTFDLKIESNLASALHEKAYLVQKISFTKRKEELEKIYRGNFSRGVKLIKHYNLESYLDINNPLIETPTILGFYAQMSPLYPFTKSQKKKIQIILKYVFKQKITKRDLLECTLEDWQTICLLKKIDFLSLKQKYLKLPIRQESQLLLDYAYLKDNHMNIKKVKEEIINLILEGKLNNKKNEIRQYLTNKYNK